MGGAQSGTPPPEFAGDTPKNFDSLAPADLCRPRPRGSIREQGRLLPKICGRHGRLYSLVALKRRWFFITFLFVVLIAALAVHIDWNWKRKLSPRGGRYFFHRVELAVPSFRQSDEKWRDDPLGGIEANGTLGGEGCAVAAAAMVFKFYGVETDPQQLNWFLTSVDGYTEQGWIYWDRAAWFAPDRVRHVYEDLASYQLIDSNLAHGNPVIVRVRLSSGITHFVVIAGKDGFDYLVRDPGRPPLQSAENTETADAIAETGAFDFGFRSADSFQRGVRRKARVCPPNVPLPTITPASLTPVASFKIQSEFAGIRPLRSRITPPFQAKAW